VAISQKKGRSKFTYLYFEVLGFYWCWCAMMLLEKKVKWVVVRWWSSERRWSRLLFWFVLRNQAEHQILLRCRIFGVVGVARWCSPKEDGVTVVLVRTQESSWASNTFISADYLPRAKYFRERRIIRPSYIHLKLFENSLACQTFLRARSHSIFSHSLKPLWKFTGPSSIFESVESSNFLPFT